jgi:DNA-binding transcriptional MerR regulator
MEIMSAPDDQRDGMTIGAVAEVLGVTVRALHHWDEIGLASPSLRTAAGYRLYTEVDLERLERVVAYRATGLGLDAIRNVLDDSASRITATLRAQRAQLAARISDLQRLDERLERMAAAHERGILLDDEEQVEVMGTDWDPARSQGARAAWGSTVQWAQFAERSATRSRSDWQQLSEAMSRLQRELGDAVRRGVDPAIPEANALVERHRELFSNFFPLTVQMQVCLGRMFEADPGFARHYDGIQPGLASWLRLAIDESARADGVDPDTATWQ